MAKIMEPIPPILSILGYWAIFLGSFGGPGTWPLKEFYGPCTELGLRQAMIYGPNFVFHLVLKARGWYLSCLGLNPA